MFARLRALVAVLLVLLHVLAPGLHSLQHAAGGAGRSGRDACGACCPQEHVSAPAREAVAGELPFAAVEESVDDHDCSLCAQLHRLQGYVAPSIDVDDVPVGRTLAGAAIANEVPGRQRVALPPARAPPRNQA